MKLDEKFWDQRYIHGETGWDIGYPSTPLKMYIDQLDNCDLRILIPGAGNAYEAEYLYKKGFRNTYVLDISRQAINSFSERVPHFPSENVIHADFFNHRGQYDLIFEQTFFCALAKNRRPDYIRHMHSLLKPDGMLVGLLFDAPLNENHPPFGGSKEEYEEMFTKHFEILKMEACYNSIPPRQGNELFVQLAPRTPDQVN